MTKEYFSVDSIDGDLARLVSENGTILNVPTSVLDVDISSGDMVYLCGELYRQDIQKTKDARIKTSAVLQKILSKNSDTKRVSK